MKKTLSLFAVLINLTIANAQKNDLWLNKNYHEVSIDVTNKNFSDLQFLKFDLNSPD
jgi:hypothetical protein